MPDISVSFSKYQNVTNPVHFVVKKGLFEDLTNHVTKTVWSPVVWEPAYRAKENFKETHLIGLDFDGDHPNGQLTLSDAIDYFKSLDISCIIGTTRNHQLPKKKNEHVTMPACDRFRVILAAEKCTSLADYEYTNSVFMENLPCDKSCKDGGRLFYACKEIVWTNFTGKLAGWIKAPPPVVWELPEGEMRSLVDVPSYIWTYIEKGVESERHHTAYKVACELGRRGFSEAEILKLFIERKSPLLHIGEGSNDVRRCIENGVRRVNGGYGSSVR